MSTQPEQEVAPSLCGGRYRLEEVLGAGGMAKVYKAFDRRLEVYRAIKILSPAYASHPEIRKRFLAEARTTARLSHPNIVTAHDIGADGDRLFIVMEMLDGGSIWDRMRSTGPMSPQKALEVMQALLPALEHAHGMGVIHRDIKPGNILIAKEGSYKLADFGIARVAEADNTTRTGSLLGTPAYMAPEQWNGSKELDGRADLFALAATLYSLVTLQTPQDLHIPESQEEQLRALPEPIRTVIQRGARYRPADRFGSAREMLDAINIAYRRLLGQEPITVPPLTEPQRVKTPSSQPSLSSEAGRAGAPGPTLAPLSRMPRFSLLPEDSQPGLTTNDGLVLELDPAALPADSRSRPLATAGGARGLGTPPGAQLGVASTGSSGAMGASGGSGSGLNTFRSGERSSPPTPMIEVPELVERPSLASFHAPSTGPHSMPGRGAQKTPYTLPALEEDPAERRRKVLMGVGIGAVVLALVGGIGYAVGGRGATPATPSPPVEAPKVTQSPPVGDNGATAGSTGAAPPVKAHDSGAPAVSGPVGTLTIECRPDCAVLVDQRMIGKGHVQLQAEVGRRTISVGEPGSRVNATVTVEHGKTSTFCWDTSTRKRCSL